jgi:phosphoglycerate dehydrogenase-like enzyme
MARWKKKCLCRGRHLRGCGGGIGAHLARRARGLGMEVIGIRRNPDRPAPPRQQ